MNIFILIMVSGFVGGMAIHSQEFLSKESCENARVVYLQSVNKQSVVFCVEK